MLVSPQPMNRQPPPSSSPSPAIRQPRPVYPRAASLSHLPSLLEESSTSMLSETQRPPSDPTAAPVSTTDGLLLLALQDRLSSQLRPTHQQPLNNLSLNGDASRLWQLMLGAGLPLLPNLANPLDLNFLQATTHPLWQHNLCAWPGCNQPCETLAVFLAHLSQAHTSDERSTSDMRAQVDLVDSLEHRLTKERNKLQAMMQHLHMKHSPDTTTPSVGKIEPTSPLRSPKQEPTPITVSVSLPTTIATSQLQITPTTPLTFGESSSTPITTPAEPSPTLEQKPFVPRRNRISDKTVLPISTDIARNREFYRTNDVRPPYTYASLIRQAIMESADCQLTLNEIYTWFTDTFAYFRRNAATWKNAVRHNLSLHKCFQRVEQNVKGAVWTVDDSEFYRRRPQRNAATRSQPNTPLPDELTQRLLDQTSMSVLSERASSDCPGSIQMPDGLNLSGGLESVLSFFAAGGNGEQNPLNLLSAAAAASSSQSTPAIMKEDPIDDISQQQQNAYNVEAADPDATPPGEQPMMVDEHSSAVTTSC